MVFFPLPRVSCKKELVNIIDDRRFFAAPKGGEQVICHAVARQARDDNVGRQELQRIGYETNVVLSFQRRIFTALIKLCKARVFEDVQQVYFDLVGVQLGYLAHGLQHGFVVFFGESENDMHAYVDLLTCGALTFSAPDMEAFPCLALARKCAQMGGTACPAMNGANEEAVAMFLNDEIGFYDIYRLVSNAVDATPFIKKPTLEQILEADRLARDQVRSEAMK